MVEWGRNVKIMVAKMLHEKKQKQLSLVLQRDKEAQYLLQALSINGYPTGLMDNTLEPLTRTTPTANSLGPSSLAPLCVMSLGSHEKDRKPL